MIGLFSTHADNYALSNSSGETSRTAGTYSGVRTDAPNLSVSLKVSGNSHVWVGLVPANPGSGQYWGTVRAFGAATDQRWYFMRDSTDIGVFNFNNSISSSGSPSVYDNEITGGALFCLDRPSAGTYTYKAQFYYSSSVSLQGWYFYNVKLLAKELSF